jgi:hypothetical protein
MKTNILGSPELQKLYRAQAQLLEDRDAKDLRVVLGTEQGRRWYRRLIYTVCRLQLTDFDPAIREGETLKQHMAFHNGLRRVGELCLVEAQRAAPDLWMLMINEGFAQAQEDAERRAQQQASERDDHEHQG